MKKILLFALSFVMFAFIGKAQITNGDFEAWTAANPDGWVGAKTATTGLTITKVTTAAHGGTNACGLTNTTTSHKRFTSTATTVTNGTSYDVSFWLKGTGQVRTGMYTSINAAASGYIAYNAYVSATADWAQVTQTVVSDGDVAIAEFIISVGASADVVIDDVTIAGGVVTPQANIVTFTLPEQSSTATIDATAGTVAIQVVNGTSLTALVPTITLSSGATVNPASGVAQDFTSPVVYTVTASDASTKTWTVTVTEAAPVTITAIYDIQYSTAVPADSPLKLQVVSISGVVTAAQATGGYYVQDGAGAWNSVLVYDNTNKPAVGDAVTVTGTVDEYNGLTEIKTITAYNKTTSGNAVTATAVSTADAASEAFEGCLVTVSAACTALNVSGTWAVNDGTGEIKVFKTMYDYAAPVVGTEYSVTGTITWYNGGSIFEILPRTAADVSIVNAIETEINKELNLYPNPVVNTLHIENVADYSKIEVSNVLGQSVAKYENNKTNMNVDFSKLNKGIYFVSLYSNNNLVKTLKVTKK